MLEAITIKVHTSKTTAGAGVAWVLWHMVDQPRGCMFEAIAGVFMVWPCQTSMNLQILLNTLSERQ